MEGDDLEEKVKRIVVMLFLCLAGTRAWGASTGTLIISFGPNTIIGDPVNFLDINFTSSGTFISMNWPKFCAKFGHCWINQPCSIKMWVRPKNWPQDDSMPERFCVHCDTAQWPWRTYYLSPNGDPGEPELRIVPGKSYPLSDPREVSP